MTELTDYYFLHTTTIEKALEEGEDAKVITLKCMYFESPEDMQNSRPKEIKFWAYEDEAVALAELILRIARRGE